GGARRWWLHHSILSLDRSLREKGTRLLLRRGPAVQHLLDLAGQLGARAVYATRSLEPWARKLEAEVQTALAGAGVGCERFPGSTSVEPEEVRSKSGHPLTIYAPFRRAVMALEVPTPRPAPDDIPSPSRLPEGDKLDDWELLPRAPDWAGGLQETWVPGE